MKWWKSKNRKEYLRQEIQARHDSETDEQSEQLRCQTLGRVGFNLARATFFALLLMATAVEVCGQTTTQNSASARRPITHADYDSWHTIQSKKLSRDGKWVAYALMPQAGDAELVVRNIASGAEFRAPIGMWPRWMYPVTIFGNRRRIFWQTRGLPNYVTTA